MLIKDVTFMDKSKQQGYNFNDSTVIKLYANNNKFHKRSKTKENFTTYGINNKKLLANYNPLLDNSLNVFFGLKNNRKILKEQQLIKEDGTVIENSGCAYVIPKKLPVLQEDKVTVMKNLPLKQAEIQRVSQKSLQSQRSSQQKLSPKKHETKDVTLNDKDNEKSVTKEQLNQLIKQKREQNTFKID